LAICTAGRLISSDFSVSSALAKVTPWIPSRPFSHPQGEANVLSTHFLVLRQRQQTYATAIDSDVACVALVEVYGAVDGGYAHVVAIRANSGCDTHVNILGCFTPEGNFE